MQVKIDDTWHETPDAVANRMQEIYDGMTTIAKKYDELLATTRKVRDAQKLYYKTPKAFNLLDEAKAAERELDDILSGKANSKQNSLF